MSCVMLHVLTLTPEHQELVLLTNALSCSAVWQDALLAGASSRPLKARDFGLTAMASISCSERFHMILL